MVTGNKGEKAAELRIIVISDGTGETATNLMRAAMIQFSEKPALFTRYTNVRTRAQIQAILEEAAIHHDLVAYTIVQNELREYMEGESSKMEVQTIDILGPVLGSLQSYFQSSPKSEPGIYREVNDRYFKRIEALEFTIAHDDGKDVSNLEEADIIILGVSRTSKTPLSIYLGTQGWNVVNIPIVKDIPLPETLKKVNPKKIIALTIDPHQLMQIRKERLERLGQSIQGDYAERSHVFEEVEYANKLFQENRRWPVFNVTGKALEETAAEINKLFLTRLKKRQESNR
jgi:hypothetical protein